MAKTQVPDYWLLETKDQRAVLGEFKKTTRGTMIALALFDWTEIEKEWINTFRIFPTATLSISEGEKTDENQLLIRSKELSKIISSMSKKNNQSLPEVELNRFHTSARIFAWFQIRELLKKKYPKDFEVLGINRTTTIDYLNLQSLGVKDYQKILAEVHNAKPLTIRDRIAYARRHNWIESVGHGERTSQMTRFAE
jgi:hypothetical protein